MLVRWEFPLANCPTSNGSKCLCSKELSYSFQVWMRDSFHILFSFLFLNYQHMLVMGISSPVSTVSVCMSGFFSVCFVYPNGGKRMALKGCLLFTLTPLHIFTDNCPVTVTATQPVQPGHSQRNARTQRQHQRQCSLIVFQAPVFGFYLEHSHRLMNWYAS